APRGAHAGVESGRRPCPVDWLDWALCGRAARSCDGMVAEGARVESRRHQRADLRCLRAHQIGTARTSPGAAGTRVRTRPRQAGLDRARSGLRDVAWRPSVRAVAGETQVTLITVPTC